MLSINILAIQFNITMTQKMKQRNKSINQFIGKSFQCYNNTKRKMMKNQKYIYIFVSAFILLNGMNQF